MLGYAATPELIKVEYGYVFTWGCDTKLQQKQQFHIEWDLLC